MYQTAQPLPSAPLVSKPTFPSGIRLIRSDDRVGFIAFLVAMHESDGHCYGSLDLDAVELMVDRVISRDKAIMAVVDGPAGIEAAIGFVPTKPWWGGDDSWFWTELLVTVRADCRRSGHFQKLLAFARWFATQCGAPVVLNVQPETSLRRKLIAFARSCRMIGGIFLVGER